jgi:hypothetical protein
MSYLVQFMLIVGSPGVPEQGLTLHTANGVSSVTLGSIPEPATFLLIATGLLLMWYPRVGRLRNARGETSQAETDLVFFIDTTNEAIRTQRELGS